MKRWAAIHEGSNLLIVLAAIAVVTIAFVTGASFWAVARAPAHLRFILSDSAELARVVQFFDPRGINGDILVFVALHEPPPAEIENVAVSNAQWVVVKAFVRP